MEETNVNEVVETVVEPQVVTPEEQVVLTDKKAAVHTPKQYLPVKDAIFSVIYNQNPELYKQLRDAELPIKNNFLKFVKDMGSYEPLLDAFFEKDYITKALNELFKSNPTLLEEIFATLPKMPGKCRMCGSKPVVVTEDMIEDLTDKGFKDVTEGAVVCSMPACILTETHFIAPDIDVWNTRAAVK